MKEKREGIKEHGKTYSTNLYNFQNFKVQWKLLGKYPKTRDSGTDKGWPVLLVCSHYSIFFYFFIFYN
jgi:hypothetical protein